MGFLQSIFMYFGTRCIIVFVFRTWRRKDLWCAGSVMQNSKPGPGGRITKWSIRSSGPKSFLVMSASGGFTGTRHGESEGGRQHILGIFFWMHETSFLQSAQPTQAKTAVAHHFLFLPSGIALCMLSILFWSIWILNINFAWKPVSPSF